jgi:hypothetical protein
MPSRYPTFNLRGKTYVHTGHGLVQLRTGNDAPTTMTPEEAASHPAVVAKIVKKQPKPEEPATQEDITEEIAQAFSRLATKRQPARATPASKRRKKVVVVSESDSEDDD